ncbi:MBL fold metallo-hydrolase [Treponema parvum]|uniref:MBL fold metallo-hydrolase n=1 Tax=Treponema parvum TaxID=138851 RepID=A0A975EZ09_9SPIR|nr:MBL fold metallo-hydrolase [Treponema parvum]QTQ11408.1 MBL fold metallo-hydrolase [Treponema parvum]
MKIYFYLNITGFSNCYLVVNEHTKEALIVDPGKITGYMIDRLEGDGYALRAVLITHNHSSHVKGLQTLLKIYDPKIYAADLDVAQERTTVLKADGHILAAGLKIQYMSLPGHTADSMIYKIGQVIFTGDTVSAGKISSTGSLYRKKILIENIKAKIFSQPDDTILLPGHGPITTVGTEKHFNSDIVL